MDDRKNTSGYVFFMGNTALTWHSKKQPIVSLSTCEAEYVAASYYVCHVIWIRRLLCELGLSQHGSIEIQIHNKLAIELAKNPVHHERSKHIDLWFHLIREHMKEKNVQLCHVVSREQVADVFTKPLPKLLFDTYKMMMSMKDRKEC